MTNDKDSAVLAELLETMHERCTDPCRSEKAELGCDCDAARQAAVILRQPTQSDALAEVGTKGKYVHDGFELACRVTAHIEGWLEVEFKGDNSPAVIRPSRFAALQEQSK